MKQPRDTRDVECPTCHAKPGAPCSKPVNSGGRVVLGDHSARFRAFAEAWLTWEKWQRWHETPAEAHHGSRMESELTRAELDR